MNDFAVSVTGNGSIRASGGLDADTAPRLLAAVGSRRPVQLDLDRCNFIDSAGLSALLAIRGTERSNLVIVNAPPVLLRLLDITDLAEHFELRQLS